MAAIEFNVNPKAGPTADQRAAAAREMFGSGHAAKAHANTKAHASRVSSGPHNGAGGGGHGGGNPNHDESGRFT